MKSSHRLIEVLYIITLVMNYYCIPQFSWICFNIAGLELNAYKVFSRYWRSIMVLVCLEIAVFIGDIVLKEKLKVLKGSFGHYTSINLFLCFEWNLVFPIFLFFSPFLSFGHRYAIEVIFVYFFNEDEVHSFICFIFFLIIVLVSNWVKKSSSYLSGIFSLKICYCLYCLFIFTVYNS